MAMSQQKWLQKFKHKLSLQNHENISKLAENAPDKKGSKIVRLIDSEVKFWSHSNYLALYLTAVSLIPSECVKSI